MKKFLIVVDMQNDFINGTLGTKEAQAILPNVVNKIKNYNGEIIFTRDTHHVDYLQTQEGTNLPVEHCIKETYGWEIHDDIKNLIKDMEIFDKNTFGSKELVEYLVNSNKNEPIDEIQLVGLCTDICVISNALLIKVFLPEIEIVVDASCCAGVTNTSHENALNAMKTCQIKIKE